MRIQEIQKIPQQPPGFSLDDFDIENATQVTTAENMPLYSFKSVKDKTIEGYGIKINDIFVSVIIGAQGHIENKPAFFVRRTFTIPEHRDKGIATSLYAALVNKLKLKLVSDNNLSPESIAVWKKLATILPVKILNIQTKEITDYDDSVFTDANDSTRLLIENIITHPDISNPELPLMGGIIEDYINYTHPENKGQYH